MSQTRMDLSVLASEALAPYRLCALASGQAVYADKGLYPWGATNAYVRSGEPAHLKNILFGKETVELEASGAISQYATVYQDDDGKITATNTGIRIGTALKAASGSGSIIEVWPDLKVGGLLYASEAASATIAETTAETAFDKSFTIPANMLQAGDILRIRALATAPSTNSSDTLNLKLKIGSTEIFATGAVDVVNGDVGLIECDLQIRTIGETGAFVALGKQILDAVGTALVSAAKGSTTLDTTAAQALTVTATWSVSHADNQVRLDQFTVELIRP